MNVFKKFFHSKSRLQQQGQTAFFILVAVITFLIICAMAIDAGHMYVKWKRLANAVDAACAATATQARNIWTRLQDQERATTEIKTLAREFVSYNIAENGLQPVDPSQVEIDITVIPGFNFIDNLRVGVKSETPITALLAKLIPGMNTFQVSADATCRENVLVAPGPRPGPDTPGPDTPGPTAAPAPGPDTPGPSTPGPTAAPAPGPVTPGPSTPGPSVPGPGPTTGPEPGPAPGPVTPGPSTGPSVPGPDTPGPSTGPSVPGPNPTAGPEPGPAPAPAPTTGPAPGPVTPGPTPTTGPSTGPEPGPAPATGPSTGPEPGPAPTTGPTAGPSPSTGPTAGPDVPGPTTSAAPGPGPSGHSVCQCGQINFRGDGQQYLFPEGGQCDPLVTPCGGGAPVNGAPCSQRMVENYCIDTTSDSVEPPIDVCVCLPTIPCDEDIHVTGCVDIGQANQVCDPIITGCAAAPVTDIPCDVCQCPGAARCGDGVCCDGTTAPSFASGFGLIPPIASEDGDSCCFDCACEDPDENCLLKGVPDGGGEGGGDPDSYECCATAFCGPRYDICCPEDRPVCNNGICCKEGAEFCLDKCCDVDEVCADPNTGLCCEKDEEKCGQECCGANEFCADESKSLCCQEGGEICGDICCGPNQVCASNGKCCPDTWNGLMCGTQCCSGEATQCNENNRCCTPNCGGDCCAGGERCCTDTSGAQYCSSEPCEKPSPSPSPSASPGK